MILRIFHVAGLEINSILSWYLMQTISTEVDREYVFRRNINLPMTILTDDASREKAIKHEPMS